MSTESFDILNNIISIKNNTDNFLEQKILENEDSFLILDSTSNKNNKPIRNIEKIMIYKNYDKQKKKLEDTKFFKEKCNSNINGSNNIILTNKIKKNNQNKKYLNNSINNIKNGYNMIENTIKEIKKDLAKYNDDNKLNNFDFSKLYENKNKIKNNNIFITKINHIQMEKNNIISENSSSLNERKFEKRNKKRKNSQNIHNRSMDYYNISYNNSNDNKEIKVDDKIKIYQKLFEIKMNNIKIKQKEEGIHFNSNNFFNYTPKTLIKSHSAQEILLKKETPVIKKENERINNDKENNINKSSIDINSNQNKLFKDNFEDDQITIKFKKSRAKRQNSLNSSISINSMEKFIKTYERFKEMENKQQKRLEQLRKQREEYYNKTCYFSPKINKKSKKIKEDFYTRQKNKFEKEKKKYEYIKLEIKKKEREKIMLDNESFRINEKRKSSEVSNKTSETEKILKNKLNLSQKSVDEVIKINKIDKNKINQKLEKTKANKNSKYLEKEKIYDNSFDKDNMNKEKKNNENKKEKKYIEKNKIFMNIKNLRNNKIKNNYSNYPISNNDTTKELRPNLLIKFKNKRNNSALNFKNVNKINCKEYINVDNNKKNIIKNNNKRK